MNQKTASSSSEVIAIQFFQTNCKSLLLRIYEPQKQYNSEFLEAMNVLLNDYTKTYENIITLGDFNRTVENLPLNGFMQLLDMPHLIMNQPVSNHMIQHALTTFLEIKKLCLKHLKLLKVVYQTIIN